MACPPFLFLLKPENRWANYAAVLLPWKLSPLWSLHAFTPSRVESSYSSFLLFTTFYSCVLRRDCLAKCSVFSAYGFVVMGQKNLKKQYLLHTRTVVRECFKGDEASRWKRPKFDFSPHQNPLTDLHQNWQAWLRPGRHLARKIL